MATIDNERRIIQLSTAQNKLEKLFDNNILFLPGVIDENVSLSITLDVLYAGISKQFSNRDPLWVIINSCGGEISQGFAIYDILKMLVESGREVYTVGLGEVASMAVCILQVGTRRFSFPSTQFTIHQASIYQEDERTEVNQLLENAKELERINRIVLTVISKRSGMEMEELFKLSNKTDHTIDSNSALKFGTHGLIDEVVTCLPFMKPVMKPAQP